MSNELGPSSRALLDAARDGLGPDADAIARMRGKIGAAVGAGAGGAAAAASAGGTGLGIKLGIVGLVAAVAVGGGFYARSRLSSDAPSTELVAAAPTRDPAARAVAREEIDSSRIELEGVNGVAASNGDSDSGRPDTGRPDSGRSDTGRPDSGHSDTGRSVSGTGAAASVSGTGPVASDTGHAKLDAARASDASSGHASDGRASDGRDGRASDGRDGRASDVSDGRASDSRVTDGRTADGRASDTGRSVSGNVSKPDAGHAAPDAGHAKPDTGHAKPDTGRTTPAKPGAKDDEIVMAPATPTSGLAREVALVDQAMSALRRKDYGAALAAVRVHARETGGRGQLAEDAAAIEIEALCRQHVSVYDKLEAFDARWPTSAQRSRLTNSCR